MDIPAPSDIQIESSARDFNIQPPPPTTTTTDILAISPELSTSHWAGIAKKIFDRSIQDKYSSNESSMISSSTCNKKRYHRGKIAIENRFFDVIHQYGNEELHSLLEDIVDPEEGQVHGRKRFYVVVRGRKMDYKKILINQCLILCAVKWRNKKDGEYLESSTFEQYMKLLFNVFSNNGVVYKYKVDFNFDGEFHGVCKAV